VSPTSKYDGPEVENVGEEKVLLKVLLKCSENYINVTGNNEKVLQ